MIQPKEMSDMYSPLDQDLMFQEIHDRRARLSAHRGKDVTGWANRRWWTKVAHRAE